MTRRKNNSNSSEGQWNPTSEVDKRGLLRDLGGRIPLLKRSVILSNKRVAADHYVLAFKAPRIAGMTKLGQFFNIRVSDAYEPLLRRPFAAHKIYRDKVEILYKVVGKATELLSAKKPGAKLDVLGPLGHGFETNSDAGSKLVVLVAGGHGVAPLVALAREFTASEPRSFGSGKRSGKLRVVVMIGARTRNRVVCENDFRKLGCEVRIATDDGSLGHHGQITDLLRTLEVRNLRTSNVRKAVAGVYACGPRAMLAAVAHFAKRHRIPCQVSLEEYVACGTGTCLGCAVKTRAGYKLVCKDGPVFDAEEIIW